MTAAPAILVGHVEHVRARPIRHRLRYRIFQILVDLDDLPGLAARSRLFSHERANLFSLLERDHGDGETGGLRRWAEARLAEHGVAIAGGRIELLCMPRVLGHVFNPISLFFCHRADGQLAAMIYEVNNTFGGRHAYVIAAGDEPDGRVSQSCAKAFHVSPFMPMALRYDFVVRRAARTMTVIINASGADGEPLLHARFSGQARPFTDRVLAGLLLSHPLLTLKVVAGIHLEAAKLMLKGLRPLPAPPPLEPGRLAPTGPRTARLS